MLILSKEVLLNIFREMNVPYDGVFTGFAIESANFISTKMLRSNTSTAHHLNSFVQNHVRGNFHLEVASNIIFSTFDLRTFSYAFRIDGLIYTGCAIT